MRADARDRCPLLLPNAGCNDGDSVDQHTFVFFLLESHSSGISAPHASLRRHPQRWEARLLLHLAAARDGGGDTPLMIDSLSRRPWPCRLYSREGIGKGMRADLLQRDQASTLSVCYQYGHQIRVCLPITRRHRHLIHGCDRHRMSRGKSDSSLLRGTEEMREGEM